MTAFVKSAGTTVAVSRSQAELERVLRRYGATGYGVTTDYTAMKTSINLRVPDSKEKGAPEVPIRLVIDFRAVYDALYGMPKTWRDGGFVRHLPGYLPTRIEQAERVAWRHLVLWVDAACSAAAIGVQRMSEAFLAHTLLRGQDGRVLRVIDHMNAESGGNWRALLPPPVESGV